MSGSGVGSRALLGSSGAGSRAACCPNMSLETMEQFDALQGDEAALRLRVVIEQGRS